jgi:hypothetical protein
MERRFPCLILRFDRPFPPSNRADEWQNPGRWKIYTYIGVVLSRESTRYDNTEVTRGDLFMFAVNDDGFGCLVLIAHH